MKTGETEITQIGPILKIGPIYQVFYLSSINIQRTYPVVEDFESTKERARKILKKYWGDPNLFSFDDKTKTSPSHPSA